MYQNGDVFENVPNNIASRNLNNATIKNNKESFEDSFHSLSVVPDNALVDNSSVIPEKVCSLDLVGARIENIDEEESCNACKLPVLPENSSVSVENSTDVIFGNVTHFTGPVTIVQTTSNETQVGNKYNLDNDKPEGVNGCKYKKIY